MINSTNTINIDGTSLDNKDFINLFTFNRDDKFSQWVLRPIAILAAVGLAVAVVLASTFLIVLSLAMLPVVALSVWAMRQKIERARAASDPVVDTQEAGQDDSAVNAQTAS